MTVTLPDEGVPINENTNAAGGVTDQFLTPVDQFGDPIGGCLVVVYKKSEYDAGDRIERGSVFTRRDGRWCAPIYVPVGDAGEDYYAVFLRPKTAYYCPETGRCVKAGFGDTTVTTFQVPAS